MKTSTLRSVIRDETNFIGRSVEDLRNELDVLRRALIQLAGQQGYDLDLYSGVRVTKLAKDNLDSPIGG